MNRNVKIGLAVTGVAVVGFLVYWFGFRPNKKGTETAKGGGDDDSEIVHDKKSRRIVIV